MGQRAGVEASHRADLVAAEGEHEHPGRTFAIGNAATFLMLGAIVAGAYPVGR